MSKGSCAHIFVGSKVPWVRLEDGLQQKQGGVPFGRSSEDRGDE